MAENESAEATRLYEFYSDDFGVGRTLQMDTCTIIGEEILTFALQYDPQSFHTDAEVARHSTYDDITPNGRMTCSIVMWLMVTSLLGKAASTDSSGVDEIRWMKSVYPGDTLSVPSTCMEVRPS